MITHHAATTHTQSLTGLISRNRRKSRSCIFCWVRSAVISCRRRRPSSTNPPLTMLSGHQPNVNSEGMLNRASFWGQLGRNFHIDLATLPQLGDTAGYRLCRSKLTTVSLISMTGVRIICHFMITTNIHPNRKTKNIKTAAKNANSCRKNMRYVHSAEICGNRIFTENWHA